MRRDGCTRFDKSYLITSDHNQLIPLKRTKMQPLTLTHALSELRSMVEQEAQVYSVLAYMDSFAIRVRSAEKSHQNTQVQLEKLSSERKQLKQKTKHAQKLLSKKEKECEDLQNELKRMTSICRNKTEKLQRAEDQHAITNLRRVASDTLSRTLRSEGSQCQFLNQSLIKELKDENYKLQNQLANLQKVYQEERNQNSAKQLHIRELLQKLEDRMMRHHTDYEEDDEAQQLLKEGDNSTIDAESLKGDLEDQLVAEWQDANQVNQIDHLETPCESQRTTEGRSWFSAIWQNSVNVYHRILRR